MTSLLTVGLEIHDKLSPLNTQVTESNQVLFQRYSIHVYCIYTYLLVRMFCKLLKHSNIKNIKIRIIEKITQMIAHVNLIVKIFLEDDSVSCLCAYFIY